MEQAPRDRPATAPGRDRFVDRPAPVTGQRERGLLDTSALILATRITDPTALPQVPMISAVTLAELSVGPLVASTDEERAARQAHVQAAESDFDPIPFDAQSARAFGRVAASLRGAGRKVAARTYDAMIAATAIANGLPLYTCDPEDFIAIEGLEIVAVPHPDRS
ncbi:MAG: type II toxin-antitoxin system VapC family toxin [Actinomycetota bacterium]